MRLAFRDGSDESALMAEAQRLANQTGTSIQKAMETLVKRASTRRKGKKP